MTDARTAAARATILLATPSAIPRVLDLFCCAGGAGFGYKLAGFNVTGVDIRPQPRYAGDRFVQADALQYLAEHGHEYDLIHASPPCQAYSRTNTKHRHNHPDLIEPTRRALKLIGKPYIIENVEDARDLLVNPLMLCGSMFGLPIERHRYFETSFSIRLQWGEKLFCKHIKTPVLVTGVTRRKGEPRRENSAQECRDAMGIQWMIRKELDEALPPVYTMFLGSRFLTGTMTPAMTTREVTYVSGGRNAADQRSGGADKDTRRYTTDVGTNRAVDGVRKTFGPDRAYLLHDRPGCIGTQEEHQNGQTPENQGLNLLTKFTDGVILSTTNKGSAETLPNFLTGVVVP